MLGVRCPKPRSIHRADSSNWAVPSSALPYWLELRTGWASRRYLSTCWRAWAFGKGGLAPLNFTRDFVQRGADLGVLLLLFMLGLEYTGEELRQNLRSALPAGVADFIMNFPPGLVAGLMLGWKPLPAILLGGATYISSSGIVAKVLAELGRLANPETSVVVSVLVLEDLAMAVYLPIVGVLIAGGDTSTVVLSVAVAMVVVSVVLSVAIRFGQTLSRFAAHQSDEVILLTVLGAIQTERL
jgi:CPA2 family monovalent cation:H+ antiporter-2